MELLTPEALLRTKSLANDQESRSFNNHSSRASAEKAALAAYRSGGTVTQKKHSRFPNGAKTRSCVLTNVSASPATRRDRARERATNHHHRGVVQSREQTVRASSAARTAFSLF